MIALVRAELLKVRTIAQPAVLLGAAVALTGAMTALRASHAGGQGHLAVPPLDTVAGFTALVSGIPMALLLAAVFGITVATGEFRHATATGTYLGAPRRGRVLLAKVLAAAATGWLFGVLAVAVTTAIGVAFVVGEGEAVPVAGSTIAGYAAGAAAGAALLAAAGVVLGSLIRSQVTAIVALAVWALIAEPLIGGNVEPVAPWLPFLAATTLAGAAPGPGLVGLPTAGAAVLLAAVVGVLGVTAARTTVRADIC